jgi:hypothetical protein
MRASLSRSANGSSVGGLDGLSLSMQIDHSRRHMRTARVIAMYASGTPVQKICDKFEISRSQVLRLARMAGLAKRPKHFDPKIKKRCLALIRRKLPHKNIAELLNISVAYVSITGKAAGLSRYQTARQ